MTPERDHVEHAKGCSLRHIPYCLASCGCCDSDAGFAGDRHGLHPEGAAARAEGIARNSLYSNAYEREAAE